MVGKRIPIDIDIATKESQGRVENLNKALGDTETAVDEVESAGRLLARGMQESADEMIREIDETKLAVDAMTLALRGIDVDPREVVADLKLVGLTAQDIEADADELAAAIKRVDDVKLASSKAGFDGIEQSVQRVGVETDKSRGAMANFASNAVTTLPGVAGAFGPVAQGVGELTERIAEGEINARQMAVALGGMVIVGLGVKAVTDRMKEAAAVKAFKRDQIDDYVEALKEADSQIGAIKTKLEGDGGLILNLFGEAHDITEAARAVGLTADQSARLIDEGKPAIDAWRQAMVDAGLPAEELKYVSKALKQEVDALGEANKNTAASTAYFGDEQAKADAQLVYSEQNARRYEAGLKDAKRATDELTRANEELRGELSNQGAYLDVLDSFDQVKLAAKDSWDAAATSADDAEGKARDYQQQLIDTKEGVLDFADQVGTIPPEQLTKILADIDAGKLEEAQRLIDVFVNPPGGRKAYVDIVTRNGDTGQRTGSRAAGDLYTDEGVFDVGEQGRETVYLPKGSRVRPTSAVNARAGSAGQPSMMSAGSAAPNVTINIGIGTAETGRQVVDALNKFYRNGGRPAG